MPLSLDSVHFPGFKFGFDDIMIYYTFSYEVSADGVKITTQSDASDDGKTCLLTTVIVGQLDLAGSVALDTAVQLSQI